jgi:SSS family solute:Na+ symporter
LAALIALTGIAATMPYIAVQLVALQAIMKSVGVPGEWPMLVAVVAVSLCTFRSGLRAPALLSIAKDVLLVWLVLSMAMVVAWSGGWDVAFARAERRLALDASPVSGLLLPSNGQLGYFTLIIGSALAIFAYPHAVTGILAAKDRATIQRNAAAMPLYCLALGFMALLGLFAIGQGVRPVGGDLNTVMPQLFDVTLPAWSAGIAYAAIGVAALIPAAVMSIAAANLFTRSIYREYLRKNASEAEEATVSRYVSLLMKFGAVACIVGFDQQLSIELQLIGGVVILQTLPAVVAGLWTNWFHRFALAGGLLGGLAVGMLMLYQIPQRAADGRIVKAHFGGSSWPLGEIGSVYIGLIALLANIAVVVIATVVFKALRVPAGVDRTRPEDYLADGDDPSLQRLDVLVDGLPRTKVGAHAKDGG